MHDKSEIPCSTCPNWNATEKNFACDPYKCKELSDWLFAHALIKEKTKAKPQSHAAKTPIQYVV